MIRRLKHIRAGILVTGLAIAGSVIGGELASAAPAVCHNSAGFVVGNSQRAEKNDTSGVCNANYYYRGDWRSVDGVSNVWAIWTNVSSGQVTTSKTTSTSWIAWSQFYDSNSSGGLILCQDTAGGPLCGSTFNNYGF